MIGTITTTMTGIGTIISDPAYFFAALPRLILRNCGYYVNLKRDWYK